MNKDFYRECKILDEIKLAPLPSQVKVVMGYLSQESFYRYFFWEFDNPTWLNVPEFTQFIITKLSQTENEPYRVAEYLVRVASKESKSVCEIIKVISPSEYHTTHLIYDAIAKLSPADSSQLIEVILTLINKKPNVHYDAISKIVNKLIDNDFTKEGLSLFSSLTEPITHSKPKIIGEGTEYEPIPKIESYELREFIKKTLPKLQAKIPLRISIALEDNLRKCFSIELQGREDKTEEDYSWIWRPAIEEHIQNYDFGDIKEILTTSLRDSLEILSKSENNNDFKFIIKRYLETKYSIFQRLALYTMRLHFDTFKETAEQFLNKKDNFNDFRIFHEYFILAKERFTELDHNIAEQIITWIDEGPDIHKYRAWMKQENKTFNDTQEKEYIDGWRLKRLWILKDKLPQRTEEIERLRQELETPKHAAFVSWHESSTGGYASPVSQKELENEDNEKVLNHLRNPQQMTEDRLFPFLGFALVFESTVKDNVQRFIDMAGRLIDSGVYPIFIQHYFKGLEEAWKKESQSWTTDLIKFAKYVASAKGKEGYFSDKAFSDARGALANYIEAVVSKRDRVITFSQLKECKEILLSMIGDKDPTQEYEKEYGEPNMDWATLSLNTTSGKVLHALVKYALRYASDHKESNTKLEDDVREKLTEALNDKRYSVRAVFGMYLANLCYLDKDWVTRNREIIFPNNDNKMWEAAWNSYIIFNNLYSEVYKLLESQYRKAIESLPELGFDKDTETQRSHSKFAEHIALAYWRGSKGMEIDRPESLLNLFYANANISLRSAVIAYLARGLNQANENGELKSSEPIWTRPRELWKWRLNKAQENTDTSQYDEEISTFMRWLEYIPESTKNVFDLLDRSFRLLRREITSGFVTKYLAINCNQYPLECARLLFSFLNIRIGRPYGYIDHLEVQQILEKAITAGDESKDIARDIANLLGERGYFYYKPIWEKSHIIS